MTSTDEHLAVLTFLEAQSTLSAYKFFALVDQPPASYKPADGVGVCFRVRGGNDGDPPALMNPSFQFKVYGSSELVCSQAARTIHDNFDGKADANILSVYRETLPVTLREPGAQTDVQWIYALVFYKVVLRHLNYLS